MKIVVYDIETLSNLFLYYDYNPLTKEDNTFVIHESRNDLVKFIDYLENSNIGQVGFNNLNFDAQVLQWILDNKRELLKLSGNEISTKIYDYSQYVISQQNSNQFVDYPEWKIRIPQLDLFKIWHFDNKAKRTGLKWIQFSIDWENLLEMPIEHTETIREDQIDEILEYCKNDVLSTSEFYMITMGKTSHPLYKDLDKVTLRKDIEKEFGIKCRNFNDVKIGDEINKQSYLRISGLSKQDLKERRSPVTPFKYRDCIPSYVSFKSPELINFYKRIQDTIITIESKQEFPIEFRGTTYMIAKGGIHSKDDRRILKPEDFQILRDADIGSQYPNGIRKRKLFPRHLGEEWLEAYVANIHRRISAKNEYKKTKEKKLKAIDEAFKLALNGGGFGKTGEVTSWQYDLFVSMSVTIGNQFEILMLIEMLEDANIHVVSANTDGIVCLFNKSQDKDYYRICEEWEKIVGNYEMGKLEYTDYELLAQTAVNSYIAIKSGSEPLEDRVKTKNEFMTDFELHKDKSARIVPLALYEYFVHNRDPKDFIEKHRNIYDFCLGVKKKGDWYLASEKVENGEHILTKEQKTIRYYISNRGCKITKQNPDGRIIQPTAGKWMQTIFNKYESKPSWEDYDINYNYYIDKTYNIIDSITKKKHDSHEQLTLF